MPVHEGNLPRSNWKLREVKELIESADSCMPGAVLKVVSKTRKHPTLRRTVQRLFPLETNTGNVPQGDQVKVIQQFGLYFSY